jgi:FtsP/CotA-like multicopper oxidase with cupredoxin domain
MANGSIRWINVTENPTVGATEDWDIYNFTADAHPIHLHLVRFEVISRSAIPGWVPVNPIVQPWENGMKDTVISYPGEITTVRAKFDIAGLYVWHCHIVEHEDNEMMRPYVVSP